jgi:tetratricopeptide (TPR) repeat protein
MDLSKMKTTTLLILLTFGSIAVAHDGHDEHATSVTAASHVTVESWIREGDAAMQRSRDHLDPSFYAPAEAAYRRALAADPRSAAAMVGLAWVHNSEHEFAEGRRWAEAALAIDPSNPDAFALIGDGAIELGDYDAASVAFQKALDIRPDLSSYSRAANLLWLTGDAERARSLMRLAIAAGGPAAENTAWCRAQLALMMLNAGEVDAAQVLLVDALQLAPANAHLLAAAGRMHAARGETEAAIEACRKSIEIAPTHQALATLAQVYEDAGRDEEARAQFETVVAFHTVHAGGHSHGDSHFHLHGPGHASAELALFLADRDRNIPFGLSSAREAHAAFPNVFAADALAWCLFKAGRVEEAKTAIAEALRLGTPAAEIHFHAGMIFSHLGEAEIARTHLNRALALNPAFHSQQARVALEELSRLGGS